MGGGWCTARISTIDACSRARASNAIRRVSPERERGSGDLFDVVGFPAAPILSRLSINENARRFRTNVTNEFTIFFATPRCDWNSKKVVVSIVDAGIRGMTQIRWTKGQGQDVSSNGLISFENRQPAALGCDGRNKRVKKVGQPVTWFCTQCTIVQCKRAWIGPFVLHGPIIYLDEKNPTKPDSSVELLPDCTNWFHQRDLNVFTMKSHRRRSIFVASLVVVCNLFSMSLCSHENC